MSVAFEAGWSLLKQHEPTGWNDPDKHSAIFDQEEDPRVLAELYAGIGGASHAAHQLGMPTAFSADAWDATTKVRQANMPEGEHTTLRFGDGDEGTHEAVEERIHDAVQGRKYHLHGSPPCQNITHANPAEKMDPKKGMEQVNWYLDLVDRMKGSSHPPDSWSMEQVPSVRGLIQQKDPLHWDQPRDYVQEALGRTKNVTGKQFGAPQVRERTVFGEGWEFPQNTHHQGNYRSINDVLPHLAQEWKDNQDIVKPKVQSLKDKGTIGRTAEEMLSNPSLSLVGAVNPGSRKKQPSRWTDDPPHRSRGWANVVPLDRPSPAITHHTPALTHVRGLNSPEILDLHGFDPSMDLSAGAGRFYPTKTKEEGGTSRANIPTMLGNVFLPPVANQMFRGIGRGQKRLF